MKIIKTLGNLNMTSEWQDLLKDASFSLLTGGQSGMQVYKVTTSDIKTTHLLKFADKAEDIDELRYEHMILDSLTDKSFAPNVYYSLFTKEYGVSLREYVVGHPVDACGLSIDETVVICSQLMKEVHNTEISLNGIKTYARRVEDAACNVTSGRVNEEDFEEAYMGYKAEFLYELFLEMKCPLDTGAFTHGDFNFPNIIYNGQEAKLIDWGGAALSDPYQDISLLLREFRDFDDVKVQEQLTNIVKETYGLEQVDMDKVEKFILLDEFF